jgi:hypothetical protein
MTWTRRDLLASSAFFFRPDTFTAKLGLGGDFAILGVSTSYPVDVEPREILGEWKDEGWRRVLWKVAPGAVPGELLASRVHKDGSMDHFRGVVVHRKGREDFLDLTPGAARVPGEVSSHLLLKLEMSRIDAVSIGTPRRMRKEFANHPGKSFHRLHLIPLKSSAIRDLDDAPKLQANTAPGPAGRDVIVSATVAQAAEFLTKHGGEASLWQDRREGTTLVQRRAVDE